MSLIQKVLQHFLQHLALALSFRFSFSVGRSVSLPSVGTLFPVDAGKFQPRLLQFKGLGKKYVRMVQVALAARLEEAAELPRGRLGAPEDLAGPIVFLASDMAAYVTGAALLVDGGMYVNLQ